MENPVPCVEGLYLVGAGTHPAAGLPGVLCSAKVLEHYLPEVLGRGGKESSEPALANVTNREMEGATR